ncbi:MAG TPA: alpha/beta hydrolase, partial [Steroidobacteraceae bacterium]|nr:alpha/beta hydrolase [Steroidobacteraceae bacterium]
NLEPLLADLDSQAARLASELRQLSHECDGAPIAVIAHSMGGLVARAALRLVDSAGISQLITLASPHHGTRLARLLHVLPFSQMRPQSAWLEELNAVQEPHFPVPLTCIYSNSDNIVRPTESAALKGARLIELRGLGHLSLLSARESIDRTLATLLAPAQCPT